MGRIDIHALLSFALEEGQKVWITSSEFLLRKRDGGKYAIYRIGPTAEEKLNRQEVRGYLTVAVEYYRKTRGPSPDE